MTVQSHSLRSPRSRRTRVYSPALLLALFPLLLLTSPAAPQDAPKGIDVQAIIFANGPAAETLAVSYDAKTTDARMKEDFANLGRHLGGEPIKPTITREKFLTGETIPTAEANLAGLTNWSTGEVNLDPLIRTFERYGHFRITCFFFGRPPMAQPQSFTRGPVRLEARVSGNAIDYEVRVDQALRAGRPLPSMAQPSAGQEWSWKLIAGLAAMAVVVALGVFLIVNILLGQRRPYGREGKP